MLLAQINVKDTQVHVWLIEDGVGIKIVTMYYIVRK